MEFIEPAEMPSLTLYDIYGVKLEDHILLHEGKA